MAREIASPPAKPLKGSGGKEAQPPDGYSNAPHGARDAHSALPIVPVNPWHHPATATHTALLSLNIQIVPDVTVDAFGRGDLR